MLDREGENRGNGDTGMEREEEQIPETEAGKGQELRRKRNDGIGEKRRTLREDNQNLKGE